MIDVAMAAAMIFLTALALVLTAAAGIELVAWFISRLGGD